MPRYEGVRKRGQRWFIRYRIPGLGQVEEVTDCESAKDAADLRSILLRQACEGRWRPRRERNVSDSLPRGPTLQEYVSAWLEAHAATNRSRAYEWHAKALIAGLGEYRLDRLRPSDIAAWKSRRGQKVSDSTLRKDLMLLRLILRWAERDGLIRRNPALDVQVPKEPRGRLRWLSREEWGRLHSSAPPWLRPWLVQAVTTGMRLAEIAQVQRADVDWERRQLHVRESKRSGGSASYRVVPLNAAALDNLRRQPKRVSSRHVFVGEDGAPALETEPRNRITRAVIAAMRAAGIPGASFHSLRHTAASWMVQDGVPLKTVGDILGHRDPKTTQRYAHLAPENLAGAVESLDILPSPCPQKGANCQNTTNTPRSNRQ